MYPAGHRGRRLICDAELAGWQVLDVSTSPEPPRVRVRVEINAEEFTEGTPPAASGVSSTFWSGR